MNYNTENESLKASIASLAQIPESIRSMGADELDAELDRYRTRSASRTPHYRAADIREALAHGMRTGFGLPVANPHPLVADMQRADKTIDLVQAAALAVEARTGQRPEMYGDGFNTIQAALTTADFPDLLKETTNAFVRSRPSDDLALLQAVTRRIDVPNYKASVHTFATFEEVPTPDAHTSAQFNALKPRFSAEKAEIHTSSDLLLLSRQALTDDAFGVLDALAAGYVSSALGVQVGMLASLLEGALTLADGDAWFADGVNSTTTALDAAGLNTVAALLRNQQREGGDKLDARASVLLVPETHEYTALALMQTLPAERRLGVVATARLSGDSWFLFADPAQHPAVARVLMQGAPASGVSFGSLRSAELWDAAQQRQVSFPGLGLEVSHSIAFAPLSRAGLVRCAFA